MDTTPLKISPVTLDGHLVRLAPLTDAHIDGLCEVGFDPDIWTWMSSDIRDRSGMADFVRQAIEGQEQGHMLPFATIERASGRLVCSTRFGSIDRDNKRVEIGWTWIAPEWHRSGINREAKYLMLRHAFDTLGCLRVEWKTNAHNTRSRKAILALGATEEGTLRKHMISKGKRRDSVYFSLIDDEWPEARAKLEATLRR